MDHLLSKDYLGKRRPEDHPGVPTPAVQKGRIGTVSPARCPEHPAGFPRGFPSADADRDRPHVRSTRTLGAGRGRSLRPRPLASGQAGRGGVDSSGSVLFFDNSVVVTQVRQPSSGSGTIQFLHASGPLRIANRYPKWGASRRETLRPRSVGNGPCRVGRHSGGSGRWARASVAAAGSAWSSS